MRQLEKVEKARKPKKKHTKNTKKIREIQRFMMNFHEISMNFDDLSETAALFWQGFDMIDGNDVSCPCLVQVSKASVGESPTNGILVVFPYGMTCGFLPMGMGTFFMGRHGEYIMKTSKHLWETMGQYLYIPAI